MSGQQKYLRFEDNKVCLTFDYINTKKNLIFMSKIDDLYSKYQILPSIVKDSRISKEIFNNCYKRKSLQILRKNYVLLIKKEFIVQKFQTLRNMKYLIIGASSGLGRELTKNLQKKGII